MLFCQSWYHVLPVVTSVFHDVTVNRVYCLVSAARPGRGLKNEKNVWISILLIYATQHLFSEISRETRGDLVSDRMRCMHVYAEGFILVHHRTCQWLDLLYVPHLELRLLRCGIRKRSLYMVYFWLPLTFQQIKALFRSVEQDSRLCTIWLISDIHSTQGCPYILHSLMLQCWMYDPRRRPTFPEIFSQLQTLIYQPALLDDESIPDQRLVYEYLRLYTLYFGKLCTELL